MTKAYRFKDFAVLESDGPLLEKLPGPFREILAYSGSYADIAKLMNVAIGTAKSRMNRARTALVGLREAAAAEEPIS